MIYKILADMTVALHFAWILFLFLGAFWGVRNRWVKYFHLVGLAFAFLIQILDWYCPLTHLEIYLRAKHNPSLAYAGSFIIYYVEQVVYLQVPHYALVMVTAFLCGLNLFLYIKKH
jgi:Protein of Unknown function (DUF2784)